MLPIGETSGALEGPHRLPGAVVLVTNVSRGIFGGIIQYVQPLERLLPRLGVAVFALPFPRSLNLIESRGLSRVFRAPLHLGFVLLSLVRILRLRRAYRTVIVHSHGASYALLTSAIASFMGCPALHTFHSPIPHRSLILQWFSQKVNALVFVSKSLHIQLREVSGVQGRKVGYIPGAVDTNAFQPLDPVEKTRTRRAFLDKAGMPDRGLLALFVGRISPEKGVLELVEAATYLKAMESPMGVLIVGPSIDSPTVTSYRREIDAKIRDYALEDRVFLTGPLIHPEKERLMAASDIFICSSLADASPISVVEALASGVPVIASRVGGLPERIRDGVTGLLVDPGNPLELAKAVDRVARSSELRQEMAKQARAEAIREYGEDTFIARHIELYSSLLCPKVTP